MSSAAMPRADGTTRQCEAGRVTGETAQPFDAWLTALREPVIVPPTPLLYKLGLAVVTLAMVLLPLVYLGMIVVLGYGVYLWAVNGVSVFTAGGTAGGARGGLLRLALYVGPLVAGAAAVLFMVKPFFAPRLEQDVPLSLQRDEQPELFAFVEKLCEAVEAPVPKRIDVDCNVNAAAGLRRGFRSLLGRDLVLVIGLPLVAGLTLRQFAGVLAHEFGHFAQGGAMRLVYVIGRVNRWFARVVYERDVWDARLEAVQNEPGHWIIALIVAFTRLMIWLSRRVLWVLMMVGHGVSCFLMRQMEYDADRFEAQVAGSDGFESTTLRLPQLALAHSRAMNELRQAFTEGKLGDNLPAMVAHHADRLPPNQANMLRKMAHEQRTGFFDTHPADRDRIASARREEAPGIFRFNDPARVLFRDFDKLCRITTLAQFQRMLGQAYDRTRIVPAEDLLRSSAGADDARAAVEPYLGLMPHPLRPLAPHESVMRPPSDSAKTLRDLAAAKRAVQALAPAAAEALRQFAERDDRLLHLNRADALLAGQLRIKAADFALPSVKAEAVRDARTAAKQERDAAEGAIEKYEQAVAVRLAAGLRLLHVSQEMGLTIAAEDRAKTLKCVHALRELHRKRDRVQEVRDQLDRLSVLLQNVRANPQHEGLASAIHATTRRLRTAIENLRTPLLTVPYPFEHAQKEMMIGRFLFELPPPPENDVIGVGQAADAMLNRVFELQYRALGQACLIAQRVESAVLEDGQASRPLKATASATGEG